MLKLFISIGLPYFIDCIDSMYRLRNSLAEDYRPHSSMSYNYPKQIPSKEFIPFEQQRDPMGRLLKSAMSHRRESFASSNRPVDEARQDQSPEMLGSKMQSKMSKYFRKSGIVNNSCELSKNKIIKKALLIIPLDPQISRKYPTKGNMQKGEQKSELKMKGIDFVSHQNILNKDKRRETGEGIRRMKSSIIPRSNSCSSPIKITSVQQQSSNKRTFSMLPLKKEELNLEKYSQLSMYHQRQKLEVKMQTFEDGHVKFIEKMRKSKQLAFDLKQNLNHIDGYY